MMFMHGIARMTFADEDKSPQQMIGRTNNRLHQINSRANALHKTQAIGCLHKTFGSQCTPRLNPVNKHVRFDPMLHNTFLRLKRLMRM